MNPKRPPGKSARIYCEYCKKHLEIDDIYEMLIAQLRKIRVSTGSLTCKSCGKNSSFDVKRMTILDERKLPAPEAHFMCPVSGCWGFALPKKRSKGFSCVDCGGAWVDAPALFASIAAIVKRHRHRKRVYVKTARGWRPTPFEKQPDDWQDLVGEREAIEDPPEPPRRRRR